jgi:putative ABC transport system permease protein
MRSVTLKGLLAHKLRLMLTALAIILGVTFISGTYVLTDTLHNTFTTLFSNIYSKIDFQARGVAQFGKNTPNAVRDPIPQALLATIRGGGRRRDGRRLRAVRGARRQGDSDGRRADPRHRLHR